MKFCTHMAYIFVGSYTKFEVDGSVRYRDIAINVKWAKNCPPPPSGSCVKGTNPALKKPSNIPEIYAKMFGRLH